MSAQGARRTSTQSRTGGPVEATLRAPRSRRARPGSIGVAVPRPRFPAAGRRSRRYAARPHDTGRPPRDRRARRRPRPPHARLSAAQALAARSLPRSGSTAPRSGSPRATPTSWASPTTTRAARRPTRSSGPTCRRIGAYPLTWCSSGAITKTSSSSPRRAPGTTRRSLSMRTRRSCISRTAAGSPSAGARTGSRSAGWAASPTRTGGPAGIPMRDHPPPQLYRRGNGL